MHLDKLMLAHKQELIYLEIFVYRYVDKECLYNLQLVNVRFVKLIASIVLMLNFVMYANKELLLLVQFHVILLFVMILVELVKQIGITAHHV